MIPTKKLLKYIIDDIYTSELIMIEKMLDKEVIVKINIFIKKKYFILKVKSLFTFRKIYQSAIFKNDKSCRSKM